MIMTMLYDYAPHDTPIFTQKYGWISRLEWLENEQIRLNEHGIKTELKKPKKGMHKGQSALRVENRGWKKGKWELMKKNDAFATKS